MKARTRLPLAFAVALLGSVFLAPGQSAVADTTHGKGCPDYRIMDYITKSWALTHVDVVGNHTGVKKSYTVSEEKVKTLKAEVSLTANTSIKAKAAFFADAKVDTGISIVTTADYSWKSTYTWHVTLPSGHSWVFYHGRRTIQGVEYGYHCHSLTSHYKVYTAKGKSFSTVNYEDGYRCDKSAKDGLAKLALSKCAHH
ncbi:hypothetical protein [Streptomyces sp. NPDC127036]|uniref:hypothetical protein n=1 Tax=Streptomyces sp. NPDC127036 TaxID=3347112 RepID=UPI0036681F86